MSATDDDNDDCQAGGLGLTPIEIMEQYPASWWKGIRSTPRGEQVILALVKSAPQVAGPWTRDRTMDALIRGGKPRVVSWKRAGVPDAHVYSCAVKEGETACWWDCASRKHYPTDVEAKAACDTVLREREIVLDDEVNP
jgi:hypothetical protein